MADQPPFPGIYQVTKRRRRWPWAVFGVAIIITLGLVLLGALTPEVRPHARSVTAAATSTTSATTTLRSTTTSTAEGPQTPADYASRALRSVRVS
jgi:hypothetical protein